MAAAMASTMGGRQCKSNKNTKNSLNLVPVKTKQQKQNKKQTTINLAVPCSCWFGLQHAIWCLQQL